MGFRSTLSLMTDGIHSILQNMRIRRESQHGLGLIFLDVVGLGMIEQTAGPAAGQHILTGLSNLIRGLNGKTSVTIIAVKSTSDDFALFVRMPSLSGGLSREIFLHNEAVMVKQILEAGLAQVLGQRLAVKLHVGSALIRVTPNSNFQVAIYNAMKLANYRAKNIDLNSQLRTLEFEEILTVKSFSTVFQPIVSLRSGTVFGVEALTRGPKDSFFQSPDNLFDVAQRTNKLTELDTAVAQASITAYSKAEPSFKLFLNLDSRTILDPQVDVNKLTDWLSEISISPQQIVIEVTERNWVDDYAVFRTRLDSYRKMGFAIAVDDVGMGYSSLQAITEINPDFIKIDRSLISHIDREMMKTVMLETLMDFAEQVNCLVIAEGIETEQELAKLIQLGIHYGQGFLLAKPSSNVTQDLKAVQDIISGYTATEEKQLDVMETTVGRLVRIVKTFDANTTVSEIANYFHENPREHSVVILHNEHVIGLVMRDALLGHLATQYGVPLYWHRSIERLVDKMALVVEARTPLNLVSRLAMERDEDKVYDSIVVTDDGKLAGIVTIQDILLTINSVHIEQARSLNPLTGLPGNRAIKYQMRTWLSSHRPFHVIYVDIDYFKWYNDYFGFHRGDQVIQLLADILSSDRNSHPSYEYFVGHIGGDDFVILTDHANPEDICHHIIQRFDSGISQFYTRTSDQSSDTRDLFIVYDRHGNIVSTSGLTLSLCLLYCPVSVTQLTLEELTQYVADLKRRVKKLSGSGFVAGRLDCQTSEGLVIQEIASTLAKSAD